LTIPASDNSAIRFTASAITGKGGNWLSISPSGNGCCNAPLPVRVSVSASSLAAGYYTGEISIIEFANPGRSMTVPVTLAVLASSKAFFDNLPGKPVSRSSRAVRTLHRKPLSSVTVEPEH
jgi:hypothetical protein